MSDGLRFALTLLVILGCGTVGGAFFAFSGFVMRALDRLPPAQGIAAMQAINVTAVTAPLMIALFGTALACLVLAIISLPDWQEPIALYRIAGGLLFLVGNVVVTIVVNVPKNNALAAVDPASAAGAAEWASYVPSWTAWNSVRAVAALAAVVLLTLALVAER